MNMTLAQATQSAEKKINSKDEALTEAIAMLSAIAHGETFGNWEYLAMIHRMRTFAAPVETRPLAQQIVDHLAKMGERAESFSPGGDGALARADAGEGAHVHIISDGHGYTLSVVDDNGDEQERELLPTRANAFDVACAVYQLIHPNAGRAPLTMEDVYSARRAIRHAR